ncbi:M20 family metallopeptidase [Streptomyces sp. NPDC048644]|uniref:M20 family metallopeptidase n=1 Tax=Streptomyces sp. NPDC048644 TaxID=3365582 RepID=UPI003715B35D
MPARHDEPASSVCTLKDRVHERVTTVQDRLVALSHAIHENPEPAFTENKAARWVGEELSAGGFLVEPGVGGLDTAFSATYGSGDFTVGVCAEYDALPEIGHACGHNIIAASAVGAALGLAEVADDLGIRVKVIGTPAEEHGGGKALLLDRGVFDDVTVAMMVHPGLVDTHPSDYTSQAVTRFAVTYRGRASHAAVAPHLGVNAADAAVIAQVAIGQLRQQTTANCRIALFVRKGGEVTNIIPEHTIVECEVRAFDSVELKAVYQRVLACFEAGAHATGTTLDVHATEPAYTALQQDPTIGDYYADNIVGLGRELGDNGHQVGGSTDMGNISEVVPSIHPVIGVRGAKDALHTRGFVQDAASPAADEAVIDGALAMAFTGADLALDPNVRARFVVAHQARLDCSQAR